MINDHEKKLGDALVAAKVLTPKQLTDAVQEASKKNSPSLVVVLLEAGHLSFKVFEKFLLGSAGIKAAIIGPKRARPDVLALIPKEV